MTAYKHSDWLSLCNIILTILFPCTLFVTIVTGYGFLYVIRCYRKVGSCDQVIIGSCDTEVIGSCDTINDALPGS